MQHSITEPLRRAWGTTRLFLAERPWVIVATTLLVGFALRALFFGYQSDDYIFFLKPWHDILVSKGGFPGLAYGFSDYPPPYLALLAAIGHWQLPLLASIKLVSLFFDIILAGSVGYIVLVATKNKLRGALTFAAIFLAPAVLFNSAAWGQSDAIYSALAIGAIAAVAARRPTIAAALLAAAFSIKLQAIFLLPVFLGLVLARIIRVRHLVAVPLVYLVTILPALIAGRPLVSVLGIYPMQMIEYININYYTPGLYQLLGPDMQIPAGIGVLIALALSVFIIAIIRRARDPIAPRFLIFVSFFTAAVVPFFLPYVNERYYYLAGALAVAYAFIEPRRWYVPALLIAISGINYGFILFARVIPPDDIPLLGSLVLIAACIMPFLDLVREVRHISVGASTQRP